MEEKEEKERGEGNGGAGNIRQHHMWLLHMKHIYEIFCFNRQLRSHKEVFKSDNEIPPLNSFYISANDDIFTGEQSSQIVCHKF